MLPDEIALLEPVGLPIAITVSPWATLNEFPKTASFITLFVSSETAAIVTPNTARPVFPSYFFNEASTNAPLQNDTRILSTSSIIFFSVRIKYSFLLLPIITPKACPSFS